MSTFSGIQQAATSLAASQYGLQVVSQNIANASTPGYTRQSVDLASVDPVGGVPRRYTVGGGPGGVTVTGTSRLNDAVIDARARTEHSRSALADTTAAQLSQIEDIFPEPSDTGLAEQLSTFWSDWAKVANDPTSAAPRTVLLQDGATVASTLNSMSRSLSDVGAAAAQSLGNDLDEANTAASSLAALNTQIRLAHNTGVSDNSLLDQRDVLLDKLSQLVGGVATINADGTATVKVGTDASGAGGVTYVDGTTDTAQTLSDDPTSGYAISALDPSTGTTTAITLSGGSAAGSFTTLTSTLPGVQNQLDAVATALATAVNGAQANGYDVAGNAGTDMFSVPTSTGPGSIAAGIQVVMTDPNLVAASGLQQLDGSGNPIPNKDGSNALGASQLGTASGSADNVYASLIGAVAASSKLAQQGQATQDAVTSSVDALRQSASGVNLDEEVTNMLTLQHAYQASSRVLSTMNDLLDTLINHTGVG
ncbi:MAG TPA: flagellar hook-associated protein FlgK [Jatrophihabitantaceae bacterium]|nr:flagellar hook-associated protein FlgK [Jatrophihabitantaceae bacterium]